MINAAQETSLTAPLQSLFRYLLLGVEAKPDRRVNQVELCDGVNLRGKMSNSPENGRTRLFFPCTCCISAETKMR